MLSGVTDITDLLLIPVCAFAWIVVICGLGFLGSQIYRLSFLALRFLIVGPQTEGAQGGSPKQGDAD